jgi:glycerate kinase
MTVAKMCQHARKPCIVLAGELGRGYEPALSQGVVAAYGLVNAHTTREDAVSQASTLLRELARRVMEQRNF